MRGSTPVWLIAACLACASCHTQGKPPPTATKPASDTPATRAAPAAPWPRPGPLKLRSRLPDYLAGKTRAPAKHGPAALLLDGKWCGHGEKTIAVFDLRSGPHDTFLIRLPRTDPTGQNPTMVTVQSAREPSVSFAAYDCRKHPACLYYLPRHGNRPTSFEQPHRCPKCGGQSFHVAVGFEIPVDSSSANDTSWFALAARCAACGWMGIVYDDETA